MQSVVSIILVSFRQLSFRQFFFFGEKKLSLRSHKLSSTGLADEAGVVDGVISDYNANFFFFTMLGVLLGNFEFSFFLLRETFQIVQ